MTDERSVVRAYSQDRQIYRHNSISTKRKTSTEMHRTSKNHYSNRNCPEILSLFALQNRHLENRQKQIYRSASNDEHYFNMINYPIQSRPATPMPNSLLQNIHLEDKETKFPKVGTRITSSTVKKFPTLASKSTSIVRNKDPIPIIRTSTKSVSSSINKSSQVKMPTVSNEKKTKTQLSHMSRRPDRQYFY